MRTLEVNLIPDYGVPPILKVSQLDKGYTVTATIKNGADAYEIPSGYTVTIEGRKPDGNGYQYDCTFTGDTVTFTVEEQMTVVYGKSFAEIVLYSNGVRIGTANFYIMVEQAPLNEDVPQSETDIPLIQEAITAGQNAQRYAYEAQSALNQFETVVAEQVEQMQIKEGQTVIDATLTVSGAAADSKTVGDALEEFNDKAPVIIGTDNPITVGAEDMPMKSAVITITPTQSGSGDPSPSNVRAISGWDSVTVKRCGKNLLPYPYIQGSDTASGVTFTVNDDGTVKAVGTPTGNIYRKLAGDFYYSKVALPNWLEVGKSYTISSGNASQSANQNVQIYLYDADGNTLLNGVRDATFTVPTEAKYYGIFIRILSSGGAVNDTFKPMIRPADMTDATYEPYTSTTYPITLPTTVYGGTLDVVKGELTVTHKFITLNGSESWAKLGSGSASEYAMQLNNVVGDAVTNAPSINSYGLTNLKNSDTFGNYDAFIVIQPQSNARLLTGVRTVTTVEAWKAMLAVNPLQIVYELATPITYTLTPTEIRTLLGANNIIADCGELQSAEYCADTKLYIDGKFAELQALILEN